MEGSHFLFRSEERKCSKSREVGCQASHPNTLFMSIKKEMSKIQRRLGQEGNQRKEIFSVIKSWRRP